MYLFIFNQKILLACIRNLSINSYVIFIQEYTHFASMCNILWNFLYRFFIHISIHKNNSQIDHFKLHFEIPRSPVIQMRYGGNRQICQVPGEVKKSRYNVFSSCEVKKSRYNVFQQRSYSIITYVRPYVRPSVRFRGKRDFLGP